MFDYKKLKDAGEIQRIVPHKDGMLIQTKNFVDMVITSKDIENMKREATGDMEKELNVAELIKDEKQFLRANSVYMGRNSSFTGDISQVVRNYDTANIENITEGDTHNNS